MSSLLRWMERTWSFSQPLETWPETLSRLRGTPARIDELSAGLDPWCLTQRPTENTWSAQEHLGHLWDLEDLISGRLDDFLNGVATLRPADITNRNTFAARHNSRALSQILSAFRAARTTTLVRLDALEPADFGRTSEHPRLQQPMRLVDMCLFFADHDDYHLARAHELLKSQAS